MEAVQLAIKERTKNRLDKMKVQHKEEILKALKKKRRFVSNSDVIDWMLMKVKK